MAWTELGVGDTLCDTGLQIGLWSLVPAIWLPMAVLVKGCRLDESGWGVVFSRAAGRPGPVQILVQALRHLWTHLLGGGGPTAGAETVGAPGASACHLPHPKDLRLDIWVPGPSGAPRNHACRKELCRLPWAPRPRPSGADICPDGCAEGSSDFWNLASSQALSATSFLDGEESEE